MNNIKKLVLVVVLITIMMSTIACGDGKGNKVTDNLEYGNKVVNANGVVCENKTGDLTGWLNMKICENAEGK